MEQDETPVTLTLFDFRTRHHENSNSFTFGMLKQKLRSKNRIAFSNKFKFEKSIDCSPATDIYDVRISSSCSCILVLTDSAFLVIDYLTHEIKTRIKTKCFYFIIEEDYDGMGNDALLTNFRGTVSKYDLKRFISEKEECKPLWSYNIPQHGYSDVINWMNLEGRHMVIVLSKNHIHFIDSVLGKEADKIPLENENCVLGFIEVDHKSRNAIYFLAGDLNRFDYVNGQWIGTQYPIDLDSTDGLFMDKVSGNLFFSTGNSGVCVFSNTGVAVAKHDISCSGLCIDEKSGLMYVGLGCLLTICS